MGAGEGTDHVFHCPECDESLEVNDAMKTALVERGCVICGGTVTPSDFSECAADSS